MSKEKICYVIMPFSDTKSCNAEKWNKIYQNLFKPVLEDSKFGYLCKRSELENGSFTKEIVFNLKNATVVLADITDFNHNVLWELGVRHSLSKRTIMVARKEMIDKIPSDIKEYGVIPYVDDITNYTQFKDQIHELFTKIEKDPERSDSPIFNYLSESDLILSDYNRNRTLAQLHSILSETGENLTILNLIEKHHTESHKGIIYFHFVYNSLDYSLSTYNIPDMYSFYIYAQVVRVALRRGNFTLDEYRMKKSLPIPKVILTKKIRKELLAFKKIVFAIEKSVLQNKVEFEPPKINLIDPNQEKEFMLNE